MYYLILVVSICVYLILHFIDVQRTKRKQLPPSLGTTKAALFFFSLVITTILFHLFWKENDLTQSGGETLDVKKTYLSKIDQDVYVGLPDF